MILVKWKQSWYCDVYSGSDDMTKEFKTLKEAKEYVQRLKKDQNNYSIQLFKGI